MDFNPLSPEFRANPYPYYEMLRANAPIFHWDHWNMWFLTRFEDNAGLLKDHRVGREILGVMSREELGWGESPPEHEPLNEMTSHWMLVRDPPTHTRLRTLVHKAFTPRMIERMREKIQSISDELLDATSGGKLDIITDLAVPLPVRVITDMLGVPYADHAMVREWSRDLAVSLEMTDDPAVYTKAAEATTAFVEYLRGLVKERRAKAQQDLITALVEAEEAGDKLTEDELISMCILLLVAGHETTTNLIGNGMLALLRNPDQMTKLQAEPGLMRTAVEELLRYDSPVQMTARHILEDFEYCGQTFKKGQQVNFMFGAANRDPERFEHPDKLDVRREDIQNLAFGTGIHYCLGAPLARMEGQIAIATLLRRMPMIELAEENPPYRDTWVLRGLEHLPVTV